MGRGLTEITLDDLHTVIGAYSNVIYMNDATDSDLLKTITGHPRTLVINLGQLLNIASGEVQGDAIAIDEIEATEIADGAVGGRELAETPSLFQTATEVTFDHDTGTGATLVAVNAAGGGDRLVICQAEVTATFVSTSWEIDVGSAASSNGLFDDIFDGLATLAINETLAGAYLLPEGEALTVTKTSMVSASAGQLTFRLIVMAPAANSIPGGLLADNAVGDFITSTTVNAADTEGPTKELLAADASNDRLILVMGVATVSAAGTPDFDVGSAVTAINSVFDDIEAGAWVIGERWVGACMLPAGEALNATITAGTGGAIDFHMIALTVQTTAGKNLFVEGTEVEQDHTTGAGTLLAANSPGEGDRLLIVQAEVTEAWAGTSWELQVGSAADPNGLFADIFGGTVPLAIGRSEIGSYLLPEGEALALVETNMVMTAGKIMFRILVNTPAAGSIPGNLLANDGVYFPYGVSPTTVQHDAGGTTELLASNANNDRIVLVTAIATETAAADPDFDVGAGAGSEVFNDLAAGAWVIGERWQGAMVLPAGSALNCTNIAGGSTAGTVNFYVTVLTPTVETAQITDASVTGVKLASVGSLFDGASAEVTVLERDWDDGDAHQLLAANAATAGDRLLLVQAHCTELFVITSYHWDVGSTGDPNGLFDDLFAGNATLGLRESEMSAYILPAGEALVLTETEQTDGAGTEGKVTFRILDLGAIGTARIADAAVTGAKLAATPSLFETATDFDQSWNTGAGTILAANSAGQGDRLVIVQAEVTTTFATTSWEWNIGSASDPNGLFADIFGGVAALADGETEIGAYLLPEAEALALVETDMSGGSAGVIRFRILHAQAAAGSIPGALLDNDAIGHFQDSGIMAAPTTVAWDTGSPADLLVADANNDRLCIVLAIAGVTAAGGPEWDVGSETTDTDALFDDIAAGVWTVGDRWVGACMLPATEKLQVTLTTAGSAGSIDFYVIPIIQTVQTAQIQNNAVTPDKVQDPITEGVAGVGFKFIMAELAVPDNTIADVDMMASAFVPSGALICGGYIETINALTETGNAATVGLELPEGADDLLAAVSVDAAPWVGAGRVAVIPTMDDPSTWILTTSTRNVVLTIAGGVSETHAVDSGNIRVVLFYIEPKTGAI